MQYFLDTVETIPDGLGFQHFDSLHIGWLIACVVVILLCCFWYRGMKEKGRSIWRKAVAILLLLDEVLKFSVLFIGGNFDWTYLPLHLCSINVFFIAWHAWKPTKLMDNFLYTVCIPGAIAALLFPTWTELPITSAMHIHSFTAHILLVMYPVVLTAAGDIRPDIKKLPLSLGFLVILAVVILGVNLLLDTNFMFLMYADAGNPLYWFNQNWGSHLLGFPVIIAAVLIVMYLPMELYQKLRKK